MKSIYAPKYKSVGRGKYLSYTSCIFSFLSLYKLLRNVKNLYWWPYWSKISFISLTYLVCLIVFHSTAESEKKTFIDDPDLIKFPYETVTFKGRKPFVKSFNCVPDGRTGWMQDSLFVFMLCNNRWGSTLRFPFHIFCLSCHAKPSKVRPANRSWGTAVGNGLGDRPPAPPSAAKRQSLHPSIATNASSVSQLHRFRVFGTSQMHYV